VIGPPGEDEKMEEYTPGIGTGFEKWCRDQDEARHEQLIVRLRQKLKEKADENASLREKLKVEKEVTSALAKDINRRTAEADMLNKSLHEQVDETNKWAYRAGLRAGELVKLVSAVRKFLDKYDEQIELMAGDAGGYPDMDDVYDPLEALVRKKEDMNTNSSDAREIPYSCPNCGSAVTHETPDYKAELNAALDVIDDILHKSVGLFEVNRAATDILRKHGRF
jgi:hypothetical protein